MYGQQDDFVNYMAFRNSVLENKIEQCLTAAQTGADSIDIDPGDLSDADIRYIQEEVQCRIECGYGATDEECGKLR